MTEQPEQAALRSAAGEAVAFLIAEAIGYVAFLINVPFVLSMIAMVAVIVIVLQDSYHVSLLKGLIDAGLVPAKSTSIHLELPDIMRLYAKASVILYLFWEIVRAIFRLKRATLRRHVIAGVVFATAGWAFVFAHVPTMRIAPGTSRTGLAGVFAFFYLLGLAGFTLGAVIMYGADRLIARLLPRPGAMDTADRSPGAR